jgi:hypothetical protein
MSVDTDLCGRVQPVAVGAHPITHAVHGQPDTGIGDVDALGAVRLHQLGLPSKLRRICRGRPQLRLAAWRAVWAALRNNPVLAARHAHLTGRADNKLTTAQAWVAVAGSLLRQLHAVITTDTAWDPAIAGGLKPQSRDSAKGAAAAA